MNIGFIQIPQAMNRGIGSSHIRLFALNVVNGLNVAIGTVDTVENNFTRLSFVLIAERKFDGGELKRIN